MYIAYVLQFIGYTSIKLEGNKKKSTTTLTLGVGLEDFAQLNFKRSGFQVKSGKNQTSRPWSLSKGFNTPDPVR